MPVSNVTVVVEHKVTLDDLSSLAMRVSGDPAGNAFVYCCVDDCTYVDEFHDDSFFATIRRAVEHHVTAHPGR